MILALDTALTTGWAVLDLQGRRVASGAVDLRKPDTDHYGARFLRLRNRVLLPNAERWGKLGAVAYETPQVFDSPAAARSCWGFAATVDAWAAGLRLPVVLVHQSQALAAAGVRRQRQQGHKPLVVDAARRTFGVEPATHDEADALWIGTAALCLLRAVRS